MEDRHACHAGRRFFLARVVPACALACFGAGDLLAAAQSGAQHAAGEALHKFDRPMDRTLTLRQHFDNQFREYIQLAKALEMEWGSDRTVAFLKNATAKKMTEYGTRHAARSADNSFATYVSQFRSGYEQVLTAEIVEDTENAFELRVSECIWADTFLRAGAGSIGYCAICWGDYAWARSFNDGIRLVRDKTLMEGDDCCNHRYLWNT